MFLMTSVEEIMFSQLSSINAIPLLVSVVIVGSRVR